MALATLAIALVVIVGGVAVAMGLRHYVSPPARPGTTSATTTVNEVSADVETLAWQVGHFCNGTVTRREEPALRIFTTWSRGESVLNSGARKYGPKTRSVL